METKTKKIILFQKYLTSNEETSLTGLTAHEETWVMVDEGVTIDQLLGVECTKTTTISQYFENEDRYDRTSKSFNFKITQKMIDCLKPKNVGKKSESVSIYEKNKDARMAIIDRLLAEKAIKKTEDEKVFKIAKPFWEIWKNEKESITATGCFVAKFSGWVLNA